MDVSVVIVNWNTRELLRACLASFPASPRHRTEVIVVDNASQDGSVEMVEAEFPDVRIIRNRENRGFAAANNQGFEIARGRHVLLLNSDTEVIGHVVDDCIDWLDARPDTAVMGCRIENPDGSLQPSCFRDFGLVDLAIIAAGLHRLRRPNWIVQRAGRQMMREWDRTDERDVDVVPGCFMLVRREAMDAVGILDEAFFFYGEEADWCHRFRDAGWRVRFAPLPAVIHHGGASSLKIAGKRGAMLSRAIVRLASRQRGPLVGAAAWAILLGSHLWRAAFFAAAGLCTLSRTRLSRAWLALTTAGRLGVPGLAGGGAR